MHYFLVNLICFALLVIIYIFSLFSVFFAKNIKTAKVENLQEKLRLDDCRLEICKSAFECHYYENGNKLQVLDFPDQITDLLSLSTFVHEYSHSLDCKKHYADYKIRSKFIAWFLVLMPVLQLLLFVGIVILYYVCKELISYNFIRISIILIEFIFSVDFLYGLIKTFIPEARTFKISYKLIQTLFIPQKTVWQIKIIYLLNLLSKVLEEIIWLYSILIVIMALI